MQIMGRKSHIQTYDDPSQNPKEKGRKHQKKKNHTHPKKGKKACE
jgi:hypothetical protein